MTVYVRVKDESWLVRGENSAILSVDNFALDGYKKRKASAMAIQTVVEDINTLKAQVEDIRSLLVQMLNRGETR